MLALYITKCWIFCIYEVKNRIEADDIRFLYCRIGIPVCVVNFVINVGVSAFGDGEMD